MAKIEDRTMKIIFIAFAVVLFLIGLSTFDARAVTYIQPILILAGVAILATEVGIRESIKNLKKFDLVDTISLGLIVILGIYGLLLLPFVPFTAPVFLVSLSSYLIFVLSAWIVVETLV